MVSLVSFHELSNQIIVLSGLFKSAPLAIYTVAKFGIILFIFHILLVKSIQQLDPQVIWYQL